MDIIETLAGTVAAISPAQICQAFFLLSTCLVLSLYVLPEDARRTLLDYGARRPKADLTKADLTKDAAAKPPADSKPAGEPPAGGLKSFLTNLTSYGQVPHSWFLHFYVVSVAWSAFWAWQYARGGGVMGTLAAMQDRAGEPSVELGRVFVAWCLMALQGSRRLYESLYVSKPGSSPMWFVHWALGLVYYTTMGISVWIEGSSAILESWDSPQQINFITSRVPSALALYFVAWSKQNECHKQLAGLKKYTLPTQDWFKYIVCPHYTCECLIYLAIAFVAAPPGSIFNRSVLCGLLFVAVNLGATAKGTKQWYIEKFGADEVAKRWNMIPFLF